MEPSSAPKKTSRRTPRKARSLCVPFASETTYARCLSDRAYYRHYLMEQYQAHPELFPSAWAAGFHFHGVVQSKKQGLRQCRVKLKGDGGGLSTASLVYDAVYDRAGRGGRKAFVVASVGRTL